MCINGRCSSEKNINIGIPQGSILGPILFILCVNDLPRISDVFSVVLYADDTTLLVNNFDYNDLIMSINNELPMLYQWLVTNRLSLNFDNVIFEQV